MKRHAAHHSQLVTLLLVVGLLTHFTGVQRPVSAGTICNGRRYRIPLTVSSGDTAHSDKVTSVTIDFDARLSALGRSGTVNETSLCVVEVDGDGLVLNTAVPFQFDNNDTPTTTDDTLLFLLDGTTPAHTSRYFHVYFDTDAFTPPTFTDRVDRQQDDPDYRGQDSFVIATYDADGSKNATYYYHKVGGGFASIFDRDGNDWISYYSTPNSKSGGEYRGIPNLGHVFHPGYEAESGTTQGSTSTILTDGPLKLTIQSISKDGEWQALWDIYPTYAQMTLVQHPAETPYWFLYEGTPGGELDYTGGSQDQIVRSDGISNDAGETWKQADITQELSPEWIYVQDASLARIFFISHNLDDTEPDSYRYLYNADQTAPGGSNDNGAMTVFAFGRHLDTGSTRYLSADNAVFTIGFGENDNFTDAEATINNAIRPLTITMGNDAPALTANTGATVAEGTTAVLTPTQLAATDPEGGVVTYTLTTVPARGQLALNGTPLQTGDTFTQDDLDAGDVAYTHDGSETTGDSFAFTIADNVHESTAETFSLTVTAVNDAPSTTADSGTVVAGQSLTLNLLQNDSDADSATLFVAALTQPAHGSVVNNGDGTVTYTADFGYTGSDTFTYRADDGDRQSPATTVTITVTSRLELYLPLIVNK